MKTDHALKAFALMFAAAGAFVVYSGIQLKYYGTTGPGPGFFPIWVGGALVVTSVALLISSVLAHGNSDRFFPSREAAARIAAVVLSFAAVWFALAYLGFRIAMFAFALVVPRVIGRQPLAVTVGIALLASVGVGYAFEHWLMVSLPEPAFDVLRDIGF